MVVCSCSFVIFLLIYWLQAVESQEKGEHHDDGPVFITWPASCHPASQTWFTGLQSFLPETLQPLLLQECGSESWAISLGGPESILGCCCQVQQMLSVRFYFPRNSSDSENIQDCGPLFCQVFPSCCEAFGSGNVYEWLQSWSSLLISWLARALLDKPWIVLGSLQGIRKWFPKWEVEWKKERRKNLFWAIHTNFHGCKQTKWRINSIKEHANLSLVLGVFKW